MKSIILCCCLLVAAGGWAAATAPPAAAAIHLTAPEKAMLALINHARTSRGRHALRVVSSLERASRSHSRDMLRRGFFSHSSYSGASYATRLRAFGYSATGCTGWKVGEIIGLSRGSKAVAIVFRRWMKSPVHRAVILQRSFRDIGVGRFKGTLRGLTGVSMFTVDFGRRVK
jgi:uncharacterized protein YkwD